MRTAIYFVALAIAESFIKTPEKMSGPIISFFVLFLIMDLVELFIKD